MNSPKYWLLILCLLVMGCARMQPATSIYDEKADARHDIAVAMATAEGSGSNIVLIFGANW